MQYSVAVGVSAVRRWSLVVQKAFLMERARPMESGLVLQVEKLCFPLGSS